MSFDYADVTEDFKAVGAKASIDMEPLRDLTLKIPYLKFDFPVASKGEDGANVNTATIEDGENIADKSIAVPHLVEVVQIMRHMHEAELAASTTTTMSKAKILTDKHLRLPIAGPMDSVH